MNFLCVLFIAPSPKRLDSFKDLKSIAHKGHSQYIFADMFKAHLVNTFSVASVLDLTTAGCLHPNLL